MGKAFSLSRKDSRVAYVPVLMTMLTMLLFFVTGVFFFENIAFFQADWSALMDDTQFFISFGAALTSGIAYLIMARRHFGVKINPGFLFLALTLLICNTIAIFLFPTPFQGTKLSGGDFILSFDMVQKVRFMLDGLIFAFILYVEFAVVPKTIITSRQISIFHYAMVIASIVAIIFSIVREREVLNYFFSSTPAPFAGWAESFTNNSNTYGVLLLYGIMSCAYLHARNRFPVIWWVLIFAFLLAMVTSLSRTSLLAAAIFIVFFFVHNLVVYAKYSPGRVIFSILLALGAVITFFVIKDKLPEDSVLNRLINAFSGKTIGSYESRIDIWNMEIAIMNADPIRWVFGMGERSAQILNGVFADCSYLCPSHNGFLNHVFSGGIIRLVIFFITLGYIFYATFSLKKRNKTTILCVAAIITLMIHGLGEDTSYFGGDTKSTVAFLLFVCPLLNAKHIQDNGEEIHGYVRSCSSKVETPKYVYSPVIRARLAFAFLIPVLATIVGGLGLLHQGGHLLYHEFLPALALAAACFFFYPLTVFFLGFMKAKKTRTFLTVLISLLYIFGAIIAIWFRLNWITTGVLSASMLALLVVPAVFLFGRAYRAKEGFWFRAFLPNLILFAICLGAYMPLIYLTKGATTYTILAMVLLELYCLLIFLLTPLGKKLVYPLPYKLTYFDAKAMRLVYSQENALCARDRKFFKIQVPPKEVAYNEHIIHHGGGIPQSKPAEKSVNYRTK